MNWTGRGVLLAMGVFLASPVKGEAQHAGQIESYWTEVALEDNTCENVTIQPGSTEVARRAGTDTLTITHAGQSYTGVLAQGGHFTTTPKALVFGSTVYTITIAGQFAGGSLTARVTVGVKEQGAERGCSYTVKWTGTRDS